VSDGIYVAMSGAKARSRQLETVANNLANIDTIAYRKQRTAFKEYLGRLKGPVAKQSPDAKMPDEISVPVDLSHVVVDENSSGVTPGRLQQTGDPLHLGLEGSGYFVLNTIGGKRYTRDGSFLRSSDGYLVARDGSTVLGKKGPIRLPDGQVQIDHDGNVSVDAKKIGTLLLVDFALPEKLIRQGANRYKTNQSPMKVKPTVHQGWLEESTVNPLKEMVDMIAAHRGFDALQQAIQSYKEMDTRANEIGRPVS